MADEVVALRSVTYSFSGEVVAGQTLACATNSDAPGQVEVRQLASGANTITPPQSGVTAKGVIILPPSGNAVTITLKGVTGDTGVALHKTDPTMISLDSPTATFVLTAGGTIDNVRLIWC